LIEEKVDEETGEEEGTEPVAPVEPEVPETPVEGQE
jgi:hypothetical protein